MKIAFAVGAFLVSLTSALLFFARPELATAADAPTRKPRVTITYYKASCSLDSDGGAFDKYWKDLQGRIGYEPFHWYQIFRIKEGPRNKSVTRTGEIPSPLAKWHMIHLCNYTHVRDVKLRVEGNGWEVESRNLKRNERVVVTVDSSYREYAPATWIAKSDGHYNYEVKGGRIAY